MDTASESPELESRGTRVSRLALTVLLCASFTLDYISVRPLYPLDVYAAGKADVPFRIFSILVMRAIGKVPGATKAANCLSVQPHSTNMLALALMAFVGTLIAVWCTGRTLRLLGAGRWVAHWVSLSVVIMAFFNLTPAWGLNYSIPYDVPALAFFCAGLWLLIADRMAWFYLLFVVATLNRETTCFLILFYVLWSWLRQQEKPDAQRTILLHSIALSVLWLVVKLVPTHIFHGHSFSESDGHTMLSRVLYNLKELCKPQQWPVLASTCAFVLPVIWLGRRWIRNRPYAFATSITLACWFAASLLQGVVLEIRIYDEWAALLAPCLGLMIFHRLQAGAPAATE